MNRFQKIKENIVIKLLYFSKETYYEIKIGKLSKSNGTKMIEFIRDHYDVLKKDSLLYFNSEERDAILDIIIKEGQSTIIEFKEFLIGSLDFSDEYSRFKRDFILSNIGTSKTSLFNIYGLLHYYKLSEDFIEELYSTHLIEDHDFWDYVVEYQYISEDFIKKHKDELKPYYYLLYNRYGENDIQISEEFITDKGNIDILIESIIEKNKRYKDEEK